MAEIPTTARVVIIGGDDSSAVCVDNRFCDCHTQPRTSFGVTSTESVEYVLQKIRVESWPVIDDFQNGRSADGFYRKGDFVSPSCRISS